MSQRERTMREKSFPRRRFLKGAGTLAAVTLGQAALSQAAAQLVRPAAEARSAMADTILRNGKIITVDQNFTIAKAIAVSKDRILAVGPDEAMTVHATPDTRVIDLKGKTVVPGLIDGHAHVDREALRNVYPSLGRV